MSSLHMEDRSIFKRGCDLNRKGVLRTYSWQSLMTSQGRVTGGVTWLEVTLVRLKVKSFPSFLFLAAIHYGVFNV